MSDLLTNINDKDLRVIADKITGNIRITPEDGLFLYKNADLALLVLLQVLSEEGTMIILHISTAIFILNQLINVSIIAGSVLTINLRVILKAGIQP